MGCAGSREKLNETSKKIRKPKPWRHSEAITKAQLMQMREEFWDTAPHYGGRKEIWDALRAAAEADLSLAQAIVDSAGVIVQNPDLTVCYDERGSWFSKFKQRDSNPENHPVETRQRGKLDFPGPCLILHPQLGEVGFCGADCDEEDDDDDDDAYWRISFNGNHLEGNHCTGGIKPLCHDSDEASQVSVLSFNTCLSCNEMKQMKGKRNCGDITLGENGSVFGRKKPIQEAQLSTPRQKDVARPSSREMCSRLERKRGDKSIKWPAERDGSSVIDSDSQNQQNEQILDQFTDPDKEDSNSSQHRASVSQEQSLGDKNFNAEKAHKKFSYRRRHSRSRKIKHNAGNSYSQTDCNTRVLSERKKARMKLKREQKARVKHGKTMYDSYAVVKSSIDPRQDFRDSVAEMIREKGIKQPEELEGLLASYLTLNCDGHHDLIIKVFLEVCFELNKDAC